MKKLVNHISRCCACHERAADSGAKRPDLCPQCAGASAVAEVVCASGCDMSEEHYELMADALKRLRADQGAFEAIRRYVALLNSDAAAALFLEPDGRRQVCIVPNQLGNN
jgi:hypothetical protein